MVKSVFRKKSTRRTRSAKVKKSTRRTRSAKVKKSTRRSVKKSSRSKKSKKSKKCNSWLKKMLKSIPEIKPKQIDKFMAIFKKYKRKFSFAGDEDKKTDCSICRNEMIFEINENNLKNLNIDISRLTDFNYIKTIDLGKLNRVLEKEVFLGCGHCFHRECIAKWSKNNPTCPLCRDPIQNIGTLKPSREMASAISEIMEDVVGEEADLKKNTTRIEQKRKQKSLLSAFAKLFAIGAALGGGLLSGSGSSNSSQKMLGGPSAPLAIGYSEGSSSAPSDFSSPTPFTASNLYDRPNRNTSSINRWTPEVPSYLTSNLNTWGKAPTPEQQDKYWNRWVTGGGGGSDDGGGGDGGDDGGGGGDDDDGDDGDYPSPPPGGSGGGGSSASSSAIDNAVAPAPIWGSGFWGATKMARDAVLGRGYGREDVALYERWYREFERNNGRPPRMVELPAGFRQNIINRIYGNDVENI